MPLGTTVISPVRLRHTAAVCRETAAKRVPCPVAAPIADSSQGVGGVCTVVSIGVDTAEAIATGR